MTKKFKNEMRPEFIGIQSLNSYALFNSSSRAVMFGSQFSQRLVIEGADEKRIQTGIEKEFGKYTFKTAMPENGKIVKVIHRYPVGAGKDSIPMNPEIIVIYEKDSNRELDYFSIPYHKSFHQYFGFKNEQKHENISKLKPGSYIPKGTVFADTPAVGKNGSYNYGINANVAFMSIPSVSEDGIMVSRSFLDKLKFKIYETRIIEFGAGNFPLNLYGNEHHYVPFPEIGSKVRDDGIIMMLRDYDTDLGPVEMSVHDVMEPDYSFDTAVYARGGDGVVVDVKVISNNNQSKNLPPAMTPYIEKYQKALHSFYKEITDTVKQQRMNHKAKFGNYDLPVSPKLHRLCVEALAMTNHEFRGNRQVLNLTYRKAPIDEYRVEIVIEYTITPNIGFKMTDQHGGKGVFVKIEEDCNMPVDIDGNRADVVLDGGSTANRMNLGRLYEHYFNSAVRDTGKKFNQILGIQPGQKIQIEQLECMDQAKVTDAWNYLVGFYSIINTKMFNFYSNEISDVEKLQHMVSVANDGIYLYMPIDNDKDIVECVKAVEQYYTPTYGPVSYVGNSGVRCTTANNVRIAPLYLMLLEKIADDWNSVATGKLQHFGVLSTITKGEKHRHPYRCSPVRTIGETEGRIFAGYCGRRAIAEMMDRSNNPATQRNMTWKILTADKPTNIDSVVDRNLIPFGGSKALQLVRHIFTVTGFNFVYEPEDNFNNGTNSL